MNSSTQSTIALLHWGDLIEDFLDSIGVSFEKFCNEMTGGWMFGYIDALRLAGVPTVLFCVSAQVTETSRHTHAPTGATICVVPAPKSYRIIRHRILFPYAWTVKATHGDVRGAKYALSAALKHLAPYLATPLRKLARELRYYRCRAILCQEYEYARFDVCVLLGYLINLPVFATFQGGDFQTSFLERPLRPLTMRACAGIIVPTRTEAQRVQRRYGIAPDKIARIFNPLNLRVWNAVDRKKARVALGVPPQALVVVWHGRVDIYRKGLDILTRVWRQLCRIREGQDLRLLMVGTGIDADRLRERMSAMHLKGVMWINEYVLDRNIMKTYLSTADVYILSSRHEGFPVAPLEAMACGLPVVATDVPGIPDILEGAEHSGGLIVPREDVTALTSAISRILDDEPWGRRLGKRARRRVENCFSLEEVGRQLRNFLC